MDPYGSPENKNKYTTYQTFLRFIETPSSQIQKMHFSSFHCFLKKQILEKKLRMLTSGTKFFLLGQIACFPKWSHVVRQNNTFSKEILG